MNTCIELSNMYYEFMLDSLSEDQQLMEAMIGSDMLEIRGITEAEEKKDNIFKKIWAWIKEQFSKLINFLKGLKDKIVGFFRKKKNEHKQKKYKKIIDSASADSFPVEIKGKFKVGPVTIKGCIKSSEDYLINEVSEIIDEEATDLLNRIFDYINKSLDKSYEEMVNDIKKLNDDYLTDLEQDMCTGEEIDVNIKLSKDECLKLCDIDMTKVEKNICSNIDKYINQLNKQNKMIDSFGSIISDERVINLMHKETTHYIKYFSKLQSILLKSTVIISEGIFAVLNAACNSIKSTTNESFNYFDELYADEFAQPVNLAYLFN